MLSFITQLKPGSCIYGRINRTLCGFILLGNSGILEKRTDRFLIIYLENFANHQNKVSI